MRCLAILFSLCAFLFFASSSSCSEVAIKNLRATTVHISVGTGSIVEGASGKDYLLTNWHVCNAAQWFKKMVASYDNGPTVSGKIVKADPMSDLCAVYVGRGCKALKVGDSLHINEQVYTRGYPHGVLSESTGRVIGSQSWGYFWPIEEVGECFRGSKKRYSPSGILVGCIATYTDNLTDLYSRPGSSGSPVVNEQGELIGVMSSWIGDRDAGGMVKLEDVKAFMEGM